MELSLVTSPIQDIDTGCAVLLCFTPEDGAAPDPGLAGGLLAELYARKEFTGKPLETVLLHRPAGFRSSRVLLVGCGDKAKFTETGLRNAAGTALRVVKGLGIRSLAFRLNQQFGTAGLVESLAEGAILGDFEPDRLKTDPKKTDKRIDQLTLTVPEVTASIQQAYERGRVLAESQNYARNLVNEPANLMTPRKLAEQAQTMASVHGLQCEILDESRLRQLGFGALIGVAQGSAEPPCLIVLKYLPPRTPVSKDHLALVGKGVTFDTGGISIKPSEGMEKMKYDMAGAAAVIGAMAAISKLRPAIPVTAYAPCVENMASHNAQRPGDIVTSLNGKTIEVLNTDAEGRLILADAITYALRQGATHVVNAATLTGAIVVALGHLYAGLFSNNESLQQKVLDAAKEEGERLWPMPLDEDYMDYLKSAFADLPNIGGRWGGAITAAKFLEQFADSKPWAHLDIASTAWLDDAKPYMAKGPTGTPVRTFARLALDWK